MDFDLIKLNNELSEKGIFKIPDFINFSKLLLLNKEFDNVINNSHKGIRMTPYSLGKCARISKADFEKSKFPETSELFFSNLFNEISKNYLNTNFNLNEEIFFVNDVIDSSHYANDLHYDVVKTLKFFVYLSDTTSENGAFQCVPGSHKRTYEYRKKYKSDINFNNRELTRNLDTKNFPPSTPIEGKAGTLIIFDTDVWHKAGTVSRGERRVMRGHTRKQNSSSTNSKSNLIRRILNKLK